MRHPRPEHKTRRLARRLAWVRGLAAGMWILCATSCLPENTSTSATDSDTSASTSGTSDSGAGEMGLFSCADPPCTFLVASQTLDDRVDVYEVPSGVLRGRVDLDLKPDPSGAQIEGNLLDEPYGLLIDRDGVMRVLVGHYPETDRGSLVSFSAGALAGLEPGATLAVADYFTGGAFSAGVEHLPLEREEPLFVLEHPSGRLLAAVFNNNLKTFDWSGPGLLLIIDPATGSIGQFDLGALDKPCQGAWSLIALDDDVTRVATACDGSNSVAVLELPADLGTLAPAAAAAAITGCGYQTPVGLPDTWTNRYLAPDGNGGLLLTQSSPASAPQLTRVSAQCTISAPPGSSLPDGFEELRALRSVVLLRPASQGTPYWLTAGGGGRSGVYVIEGGSTPRICGEVKGLEGQITGGVEANEPHGLALTSGRDALAVGAGPTPENFPEMREGRGQLLWLALDTSGLDDCAVTATSVVDLTAGSFEPGNPKTWVRAPNALHLVEVEASP